MSSSSSTQKPKNNTNALSIPYDRTILDQVKLGKGKTVKKLRDEIQAHPKLAQRFIRERTTEIENGKQKEKMMWVKDANSRVRRVENEMREFCTYTNPMNTHVVPDRDAVQRAAAAARDANQRCNGMSLFN